ncbi:MAG: dihydrolipoyl dehydrogenase [Candidatus Omnitrophica bacterium]|nr:dihydrolipoyl dehydrogenase [Candidatus Omnitrophota bacterium]
MALETQLAIIGAGPGGYAAAFHAADMGLSVTLIDRDQNPGGVCLYRGCIPSKALLHAARIISEAEDAKNIGIDFGKPVVNIEKLRSWKEGVVSKLTGGLGQLTKQRKITYIQGEAAFSSSNSLNIKKTDGTTDTLSFKKAIIATGSRPIELPFLPKSPKIWDSTGALTLPYVPPTLLIIGGGYIGMELGSAYAALGAKVSVVEALPQLLSGADRDLADIVIRRLKKNFTRIMLETKVIKAEENADGVIVTFQDARGQSSTESFAQVLTSIGRKPNTDGLGLEKTKIKLDAKGFITVNAQRCSEDECLYAIGDITGQPMLAHKASAEAKVAAEAIAGHKTAFEPKAIPAVVFTDPELAWAGITETEAKAQNLDITVFKFPWAASGRAMTLDRMDGVTKLIADTQTKRILGIGIAGIGAGDMIAEGVLAIEMGAVAEDLALTIHPHPTLSETIMETAEGLFGQPTHISRSKKI